MGGGGRGGRAAPQTGAESEKIKNEFVDSVLKLSPDSSKCAATHWSSLSPDPKSEFGQIDMASGRMMREGEKAKPPQPQGRAAFGRRG